MDDFLQTVALLRAKHHRPAGFNLFSVLRSESDEVRLHSRFLASLLNPKGTHGLGTAFLDAFLQSIKVKGFETRSAAVQAEYRKIDVLIRNSAGQAIVIENKIYAGDQDEQIYRYHLAMQVEGVQDIRLIYLTLNGSAPSEQSSKGLSVQPLSYEIDILDWLKACIPLVAREPALREAVFQYIELLQKLTSSDQGEIYMSKLKEQILRGDNLLLIQDIEHAYKEILIDFQLNIWERMKDYQLKRYPEMGTPNHAVTRSEVRDYYFKKRNNRFLGFGYPFGFMNGGVGVEIDHRIYYGVYCYQDTYPKDYARLKHVIQLGKDESSTEYWPLWKYASPNPTFLDPGRDDLELLRDEETREQIARGVMDNLYQIWVATREKLEH